MIELPGTPVVPVVRIDFSDQAAWVQLRADLLALSSDGSGYETKVEFVDWRNWSGRTAEELDKVTPRRYPTSYLHCFMVVVDAMTMRDPEHPVYLIDLNEDEASDSFCAIPREFAAIEANLTLGQMTFDDFGDNADEDRVFRGFA